jgi:hypothetical protein
MGRPLLTWTCDGWVIIAYGSGEIDDDIVVPTEIELAVIRRRW